MIFKMLFECIEISLEYIVFDFVYEIVFIIWFVGEFGGLFNEGVIVFCYWG